MTGHSHVTQAAVLRLVRQAVSHGGTVPADGHGPRSYRSLVTILVTSRDWDGRVQSSLPSP